MSFFIFLKMKLKINKYLSISPTSEELRFHREGKFEVVKIEPLPMEILLHLLKNKGKVCTNQELIDYIWDGNQDVGKPALRKNIYKLRSILTKFGEKEIIQTIPKKGYRFKENNKKLFFLNNSRLYYIIGILILILVILKIVFPGIVHRLLH